MITMYYNNVDGTKVYATITKGGYYETELFRLRSV